MASAQSTKSKPGGIRLREHHAVARAIELMGIPGKSGDEARVAQRVVRYLKAAGIPAKCIQFDQAHKKSPMRGLSGNLICTLPGTIKAPRRLLMAHLDTVPLCVGSKPKRKKNKIKSSDPKTALGGDDRGGVAVVLTAVCEIFEQKLPHPPLTLFFPIQEEVGMLGIQYGSLNRLGNPELCFNWDGGEARELEVGATGAYEISITVKGLASHAGMHPERGASAIVMAGLAVVELQKSGWLGLVRKGKHSGTSNIGIIRGGDATNVVTDEVVLQAEARSHHPTFRKKIVAAFRKAFERAVSQVKSDTGKGGRVIFRPHLKYEAFHLKKSEPCLQEAIRVIKAEGLRPNEVVVNGGLDANWMIFRGFPTVTLGNGQIAPHTVDESLDVKAFLKGCRIALRLATGT